MIRGVDTTFLVEVEVAGHPNHETARTRLDALLSQGDSLAIAPQVLAEFVHVVTDPKRFSRPLTVSQAVVRAQVWWDAREVVRIFPTDDSCRLFLEWLAEHNLGRKRLLDTMLAATYHAQGIRSILSSNARDYAVFGCFEVIGASPTDRRSG
jgi:predicted nucleic acid-binding protein